MKSYAIAILLLAYVHSQCTDGCLTCTNNDKCQVCDVTNGYYLAENTCQISPEKHCQVFDLSGNCLFCNQGYYTDPNAEQCIEVLDSGDLDSNCQRFNLERQCVQCREKYFLLGNTCLEVPNSDQITGCVMYNTKDECVECTSGKTLNLQGTQCLENSDVNHCFEQTTVKCNQCKTGYTLNPNFFLLSIQISMESTSKNSVYQKIENFFEKNSYFEEGCLKNMGSNCLAYSDFNQCIQCESEHYLQNGTCYAFPKEQIENCKIYLNQLKCKECQQGYILTGTKNCQKIENNQFINNCVLYNPSSQNIQCLKCKNNYYVNSSLSCQQRQKDISNCKTLSFNSDACQICQDDYKVTDDGLKCLFKITNCLTYKSTSNSNDIIKHVCEVCNSGLYFNELQSTCEQGQVQNCEFYTNDANSCTTCQNGYYLENDVCAKHDNISNCEVYNKTIAGQCSQCNNTSILMTQTNDCDFVQIQGCEVFNSTSSCQTCKDGYDLTNNLCTFINSDLHCKRSQNGVCNLCLDQYFLNSDNKCYLPFKYERLNCFTNKNDGNSNTHFASECKICQDFSVPYNLKNYNVCISVDEFSLVNQNPKIANCERYQIIGNEFKCKQCEKTFILSSDNSSCGLTCPTEDHHKLNFKFEDEGNFGYQYKNHYYCVTYSGTNVSSVTLDQDFAVTSYKLDSGHNYLIDFTKMTNFKLIPPENIDQVTVSTDLYTLPDYKDTTTIEPTDNTIGASGFIDTLGNKVDHCEYYFEKHSQYKCAKCEFGYFGKIDFFKIDNCYTYNETEQKCDLCEHQYKLAADKLSCVLTEIEGCAMYEKNTAKCAICDDQFYLDKANDECKKSTITNCKIHDPFAADKCLVCNKGYLLHEDQDLCGQYIENCQKNIFKAGANTMECEQCDFGYFSQTNKTECDIGTEDVHKCYEYEDEADQCETYINIMKVTKINKCLDQKHKCVEFSGSDASQCIKCYEEDYYLVGGTDQQDGVCCKYFTYPDDGTQNNQLECTNKDTGNPNCKKFKRVDTNSYQCEECQYGYFMNPSAKDPADDTNTYPGSICCPWGQQQDDSATKKCIDKVIAKPEDDNHFKCSVYDLDKEQCVLCKEGLYMHKDKCCTIGKYHNGDDNFRTLCSDTEIPTAENCDKYNDDNECISCRSGNTLSNGICCTTATSFAKATAVDTYACAVLNTEIPNCIVLESSTWEGGATVNKCKTCSSTTYLTNDNKSCCIKATDNSSQIYSTDSCKSLDTLNMDTIANCEIYNAQNLCTSCTSGFPSIQGKICCASQEIYDLDVSHASLNCRSIGFIYQNCDNIIGFTAQDNFCKSCKDGYYKINNRCVEYGKYMKKLVDNTSGTEEDTVITDALVSFDNATTTSNCSQIEYVSEITNPSNNAEKITAICKKCKDGFILDDLYVGGNYNLKPCKDEKYEQGYYNDTAIQNDLVKINTYTQHCLLFDQINNMCQQTDENDSFSYGYCANYGSSFYYKMIQNQLCCQSGYHYNTTSNTCVVVTYTNCLLQANDGGDCKVCKDGFYLKSVTECAAYFSDNNCKVAADDSLCERCVLGYYLNGTCKEVTQALPDLNNCATSANDTSCDTCHPGYYLSQTHCCRLGTYKRTSSEECISIPFENCAKYDGTVCDECFTFENNYCFNTSDWIFKIGVALYSPYVKEGIETYSNYDNFMEFYHSQEKGCCKEGYYWKVNAKVCQIITVENCLRIKKDAPSECIKCKPNYQLANNNCSEINEETTGFYQSNNIYCEEYFYYDAIKNKCLLHPDKKCKKASNNYSCDECDTGFTQSTFYKKLMISHNAGERDDCFSNLPDILFQPCVQSDADSYPQIPDSDPLAPITITNDLFDYDKMYYRRNNCNEFDLDNQKCKTDGCVDGYYLVEDRCCKNDEYPLNDGCIDKEEMHDVCNSYDISTYKCLGCEIGHELSNGFCCKEGEYYNTILKTCIKKKPNCKNFLTIQDTCTECQTGFYMNSNNYCCPLYTYYDQEQDKCVEFSGDGMFGCKKGIKDQCYECSQQNHYYFYNTNISNSFQKTKGKCCQNGFIYDTSLETCIPHLKNCKQQDAFENCISCQDGYYISDVICCPYGSVSDGNGNCVIDATLNQCKEFAYVSGGPNTCSECNDGFYLVQSNCCPYFYTWNGTDKCIKIDIPAGDKYQRLSSINCKIFNEDTVSYTPSGGSATTYHTCDICQDGYYLSQESDNVYFDRGIEQTINRCCPFNMRTQTFANGGCEKIHGDTETDQDMVALPTPVTDCIEADYLQVSSLDGSPTTDYDQQIVCTRCKDGKVVHIDFRSYEDGRTANSGDIPTAISNYVTCENKTSVHNDQCWAYFVDTNGSSDVPTRYCLNFDRTKYYLTNMDNGTNNPAISQIQPCQFGYYYKVDECRQISEDLGTSFLGSIFANCDKISGTAPNDYVCTKCKDNYYLDTTATNGGTLKFCIAESTDITINNCLIERQVNGGTNVCLICNPGYKKNGTACVDGPQDNSELYYKYCSLNTAADKCTYCSKLNVQGVEYQTYLTNGGCCLEGQYFDPDFNVCASDDNCLAVDTQTKDQTQCQLCNYKKDLFVVSGSSNEGYCCKRGTVIDTAKDIDLCHVPTLGHLKQCKYFKSKTECRQLTNLEKKHLSEEDQKPCFQTTGTTYYYHDSACCPEGQYSESNTCNTPTDSPQTLCKQFEQGSTTNCVKCDNTSYLTNKTCCVYGNFWNGNACAAISTIVAQGVDSLCTQYINGQCLKCSSGEVNYLGCCGDNFRDSNGLCKEQTLGNVLYQVGSIQCANGKYLTNGICCDFGQYKNGNACVTPSVIDTSCLIPDPNTPTNCQLCKQGMKFAGGKCCELGKFYSSKHTKCIDESIIINCLSFNGDGECTKCKTDNEYYINQDMCCPLNTKYDNATGSCIQIEFQCSKLKNDNSECEECNEGYYVNPNDNKKCCLHGYKPGAACRQPTISINIENCTKFNTNSECIECNDNYNLYGQVCCPSGLVLLDGGYNTDHCVTIDKLYENCDSFNPITLKCTKCQTGFYNDKDQSICCGDNKHFSLETGTCIDNYKSCLQQKNDECTKCSTTTYLNGVDKKIRCCPDYSYFDKDENKCIEIEIDNCKQIEYNTSGEIICKLCQDSNPKTHLTNDHCCLQNSFWDKEALMCSESIKYCTQYDGSTEDANCLSCASDYFVLKDKKKCCARQKFYFPQKEDEECLSEAPLDYFSWTCTVYDPYNFQCTACRQGYYLMDDHCCEEGTYYQANDTQVCQGSLASTQNCIQGDSSGVCTKCKLGFKLATNKSCVEILDNCDEFNADDNECTKCSLNYFVTPHGYCCEAGQSTSDAATTTCAAANISIDKCVQIYKDVAAIKCKICEIGYYVSTSDENVCCQNGFFCSSASSSSQGTISNCKQYETDSDTCTKCYPDYSLMEISGNKKYCYPTPFENCMESIFNTNTGSSNRNPYQCSKCADGYETKTLTTAEENWIRPHKEERCFVMDVQKEYQTSTFKCKYCSYEYYLDTDQTCKERTEFSKNNCEIRDWNADKCDRCDKGYYLNQDINDGVADANKQDQCQKKTECKFEVENSDGTLKCAQCIDTYTMILDTLNVTTIDAMTSLERQCLLTTDLNALLIKDQTPEFTNPEVMPGIIKECEKNYQCKDIYLNGLDINLHKYLSCHVCSDEDRIPFISLDLKYETNNIVEKGIKMFFYKNSANQVWSSHNENKNGKQSQCFRKNLDDFNVTDKSKFPSHCAVGVINANQPSIISQTDSDSANSMQELGIFCVACEPGYKPLFSTTLDYHVYDCQEITNCQLEGDNKSQSAFNECDHCQESYYHPYTEANGLDKTQCIQSTVSHDPLCYAFDTENNYCKACMNGYQKNYEDRCEKLEVPYCEEGQSNFKTSFQKKDYRLAIYRGVEGCQNCQTGYLPLYRNQENDYTCIYSSYANQNAFRETNQKYPSNCRKFYWDQSNLLCSECLDQFIVTDQSKCIAVNNSHSNCLVAKDSSNCHQCNLNTILVLGKCLEKSIENCLIYEEDEEELLCQVCQNGFYLSNNICNGGLILNCARYASQDVCSTCNSGYQLIQNQQNKTICIEVISHVHCEEFNTNQFNSMNVTCNKCSSQYYLNESANDKKICLPFQRIDGCLEYDVDSSFSNSSLQCVKCQVNMYLKDSKCFIRQIKIPNCLENDPLKDACSLCADNYYLSEDQMECISNPTGTVSCAIYNESNICILCKPSFYLMNQKCFQLSPEETLQNCEAYNESKECMKCIDGYILEEKNCVLKNINNCLVYQNSTNCEICQTGYGIEAVEGVNTCVLISIVSSCAQYSQTQPFPCILCQKDYYLNTIDNQCVAIEEANKIKNCQNYSLNQTCEGCESGYILSQDQKTCILLNQQSNCDTHIEQGSPFCIKCNVGYSLNKEYKCVEGSQNSIENCLVTQLNNSQVCSLCKPGYYMKKDNKCYKSSHTNDSDDDSGEDDDNNGNGGDSGDNGNNPSEQDDQDGDDTDNSIGKLLWASITLLMMLLI